MRNRHPSLTAMSGLLARRSQSLRRGVPDGLSALLRAAGAQRAPLPGAGAGDAGDHRPLPWRAWPGRDLGVRAPMPGETPLSWDELVVALKGGEPL